MQSNSRGHTRRSELLICGSVLLGRQEVLLFWEREVREVSVGRFLLS